jgi:hypothetical protein
MRRQMVLPIFAALAVTLSGCGSSNDEEYVVGNPDNVVIEESTEDEGFLGDIPVVDVKVTELPPEWPNTIPILANSTIDNVIVMDETITATWIVESDDLFALNEEYLDGLRAGGFETGESDATEFYAKGEYSNETHSVSFTITPLSESTWQLYVTYEPRQEE